MSANGMALAMRNDQLPDQQSWQTMLAIADQFHKSGLMPPAVRSAAAALAIIQKGRELGIPPMAAVEGISIIQGRPTCSATLMLGLIKRDYGRGAIRVKTTTNDECTVEWRDEGWDGTREYQFTIEDARRAELVKPNSNWIKYPAAMLRARCVAAVARMAFPEVIGGMYTHEELGGAPADADIIDVTPSVISHAIAEDRARTAHANGSESRNDERTIDADHDTEDGSTIDVDGTPIDSATGEIVNGKPKDPRTVAMSRLHAAGAERGLDHDALHRIAAERFGVESLAALVQDDIGKLIEWVERVDATGWQIAGGWMGRLHQARNAVDRDVGAAILTDLRGEWLDAGVSDPNLGECYRRTMAIVADKRRAPKMEPPDANQPALENMPPPTDTAGDDRFTN